jgi:hypothetical protein
MKIKWWLSQSSKTCGRIAAVMLVALTGVASIIGSGEGITCCGFEVSTVTDTEPDDEGQKSGPDQFVSVTMTEAHLEPDFGPDGFIDFELSPNGDPSADFDEVGDDYADDCIVFRNLESNDISRGPEYRRIESANNTLVWDNDRTFNPPPETDFNITADFSVEVSSVEADVFAYVGESITMTAFDSSGGILDTITSADSVACCRAKTDTLKLSGIGAITTVTWKTSAPKVSVPRIDNIHFERVLACGNGP